MDSWERLACYPQGSFYPLSDGPSTRYHRITKPYFRTCSSCLTRSQAPFCLYTLRAISGRAEGTFGRLRYSFGGDRPSQTARLTLSRISLLSRLEFQYIKGGIPTSAPARLASSFPCLPPILYVMDQNPLSGGQFDWGGRLPKSNGGAQRFSQYGRKSYEECKGKRELDCKTYRSSKDESRT